MSEVASTPGSASPTQASTTPQNTATANPDQAAPAFTHWRQVRGGRVADLQDGTKVIIGQIKDPQDHHTHGLYTRSMDGKWEMTGSFADEDSARVEAEAKYGVKDIPSYADADTAGAEMGEFFKGKGYNRHSERNDVYEKRLDSGGYLQIAPGEFPTGRYVVWHLTPEGQHVRLGGFKTLEDVERVVDGFSG